MLSITTTNFAEVVPYDNNDYFSYTYNNYASNYCDDNIKSLNFFQETSTRLTEQFKPYVNEFQREMCDGFSEFPSINYQEIPNFK